MPTSNSRSTAAPTNRAVTAASSATGMSVVPAQTTATNPSGSLAGPGAGDWKVREISSYVPPGAAASAAAAASAESRVTSTPCSNSRSRATSSPICAGDLPCPKITSGTPCRTARSPSSCANSATRCTGSSASLRAASATGSSPRLTRSRNSCNPFRSIPPIYTEIAAKAFTAKHTETAKFLNGLPSRSSR